MLTALGSTFVPIGAAAAAAPTRPNIVVFLADDMGFADCGPYGCRDIPTPCIDRLAASGVRFANGYTSACVCSPTRAALLTGRYQQRYGFEANAERKPAPTDRGPRALDLREITFAQRFKELGYTTGIIGKWHIGSDAGYLPTQRGFDEFYGLLPFGIAATPKGPPIYRGTSVVETPADHMEQFGVEALSFIDRHRGEPFFLYMAFTAVHGPNVGPQHYLSRFKNLPGGRDRYAADLAQMDDIMGRVVARLRQHGLEENTLVFFLSDNGGAGKVASNGPLRGTKWTLWEGGIHVPFIVQWKGRIPGGRLLDAPVIQVDILPTALAAAGASIRPEWKLDGVNLLPYMQGETSAPPHEALFWRFGVQYAVRQGDWKLVKPHVNDAPRLFNLARDLGESEDLAAREPDKVKSLQALWDRWNAGHEAPRWVDERWDGDGTRNVEAARAAKRVAAASRAAE